MKNKSLTWISLLLGLSLSIPNTFAQTKKPNIILVMVDDMGYSDLGAYGSEINTPNIDKLAFEGIRLKEFYNNSICAPTRASLITGQYPHKAGVGYFDVNLGLAPYQGFLNKESLTFGEVLKTAGYNTFLSGKWHVGKDKSVWPTQRGFDQFYGILGGGANYFDAEDIPLGKPYPVALIENNQQIHPKSNSYYFTDEVTNHAIKFISEPTNQEKPFFLYLAYTAPHWPLQALPEDIAKYKGKYNAGWDALRKKRLEKLKALGLLDEKQSIAEKDAEIPDWDNLTYDEKQLWKAKMEVYAAMLDRVDQGIGKLLTTLKELKQDENTLIVFISDNGAPAEDVAHWGDKVGKNAGPVGTSGSFESQGKNWSFLSNSPFRSFKSFAFEGGISSPFIAWFPKKIKAGNINKGTAHLIDLAPTFYELAEAKYPETFNGLKTNPLPGKSLTNLLFENKELQREEGIFWERAGNRAVRKGKWKLVSIYPSYQWQLFDIEKDRGETQNVASKFPLVVDALSNDYFKWAAQNGVVDYDTIKPATPLLPVRKSK
ncbi:arylsulfatase [Arcicella sp. DC2W]|uniref:Arylsulfatase n=1 Tax=Arcicella gelida TaxID=2984195 RepID=A0ABU5S5S5_9BACT|nr:arylsulfatase [Arcicella sp. DC2W]MEA5403807.1 arylsulfatase [Arcicella sp. DC2W]